MSDKLLDDLKQCRDIGEIVNAVTSSSLAYSGIQRWTFVRDPERRALRFFLELTDQGHHSELARSLGGKVIGNEICFEVPLPSGKPGADGLSDLGGYRAGQNAQAGHAPSSER